MTGTVRVNRKTLGTLRIARALAHRRLLRHEFSVGKSVDMSDCGEGRRDHSPLPGVGDRGTSEAAEASGRAPEVCSCSSGRVAAPWSLCTTVRPRISCSVMDSLLLESSLR